MTASIHTVTVDCDEGTGSLDRCCEPGPQLSDAEMWWALRSGAERDLKTFSSPQPGLLFVT